jgi:hydrogenase maturation protease
MSSYADKFAGSDLARRAQCPSGGGASTCECAAPARGDARMLKREHCAVLVIGYGNTLRMDDGVGPAIVEQLAETFRGVTGAAFVTVHQLMPELAEELSGAKRAVFVDASVEKAAGKVAIRRVSVQDGCPASAPLGHHASPEGLLALCSGLYGRAPVAWSIGVGVSDLEVGDCLSPLVARAANRLCRRLAYRIREWCRTSDDCPLYKEGFHVC